MVTFSQKRIFGRLGMIFAMVAVSAISGAGVGIGTVFGALINYVFDAKS